MVWVMHEPRAKRFLVSVAGSQDVQLKTHQNQNNQHSLTNRVTQSGIVTCPALSLRTLLLIWISIASLWFSHHDDAPKSETTWVEKS